MQVSKFESARNFLRLAVIKHLASNARGYTACSWTGEISHNMLGGVRYLDPQEGTVCDENDEFSLVKTGRNDFCVVAKSELTEPLKIGSKVRLTFYQLRRLDGTRADGRDDVAAGRSTTIALTGAKTLLPVKWEGRYLGIDEWKAPHYRDVQNPYLRDMIKQLEDAKIDDGLRTAANLLVDAGVRELDFIDPPEDQSSETPPSMLFNASTKVFQGSVQVAYDRGMDYYTVTLRRGAEVEEFSEIDFMQLPDLLKEKLDDGEWRKVKVEVLKPAPRKRVMEPA